MPKKTTLLIILLAAVTGILLFLALASSRDTGLKTDVPPKKAVEKTARVFFNPLNVDLSAREQNTVGTVDITVDTGGTEITGVQAEMQYDPKTLTNVRLLPDLAQSGFFGPRAVVLFNEVNATTGRISFVIAINTGDEPKKGTGKIATLNFERGQGAIPSSTQINFLDKTLVTTLGVEESVLKETTPLSIILFQGSTQATPQTTSFPRVTSVPPTAGFE